MLDRVPQKLNCEYCEENFDYWGSGKAKACPKPKCQAAKKKDHAAALLRNTRQWRKDNPGRSTELAKRGGYKHQRNWAKKNKDKVNAARKRRRAKRKAAGLPVDN
jgi:hypothetical protein